MRRDALSCAGNANLRTPHLDRLAQRGVRFTAACWDVNARAGVRHDGDGR